MKARSQANSRRESSTFQQDSEKSSNVVLKGEVSGLSAFLCGSARNMVLRTMYAEALIEATFVGKSEHLQIESPRRARPAR
jgi:hypothetical protein